MALFAVAFGCCMGGEGLAEGADCEWLGSHEVAVSKIFWPPPQDIEFSKYGYSFPYVLYVPAKPLTQGFRHLIVESNNPGKAGLDATEQLVRSAIAARTDYGSLGHALADALKAPLLMPVFPRPKTVDRRSNLYTHSLSRDAMDVASGPLHRLDLQLIAMTEEAVEQLAQCELKLDEKIAIDGFSASGVFANRFVMLHPDRVVAAAYGGTCGFLMLPVAERDGITLDYPLGTADYARFAGKPFDARAFNSIPQLAFVGAEDTDPIRDCLPMSDSFNVEEREAIWKLVGAGDVPHRWLRTCALFQSLGSTVQFKTYLGLGHAWYDDGHRVVDDVTQVFRTLATTGPSECGPTSSSK